MTDTQGRRNLVPLAKPVEKGSEEAQGQLTMSTKFKPRPRRVQKVVGTPMKGVIPLAAGQPVEGPRHRVRLTVKSTVPKQASTPVHVPTPGGSSSSKAPPEIAMPKQHKFSRVDIDAYTRKKKPGGACGQGRRSQAQERRPGTGQEGAPSPERDQSKRSRSKGATGRPQEARARDEEVGLRGLPEALSSSTTILASQRSQLTSRQSWAVVSMYQNE